MKFLLPIAAALLLTAASAHARVADCDPEAPTPGCPGYHPPTHTPAPTPPSSTAIVGPVYVFGTHNTKATVLVYDTNAAKLCSPDLTNCRPAFGLGALQRGTEFAVAQLLKWDRSAIFAINATEIIACFNYFDSPGGANFNCATAARNGLTGYQLSQAATLLGNQTYSGSGLTPLSTTQMNAAFVNRKRVTAYLRANGTLPEDRMHALSYEDFGYNGEGGGGAPIDPGLPDAVLNDVVVVGKRDDPEPAPITVPAVEFPTVEIIGTIPRDPLIIIDPCVSFAACMAPPPPPPPPAPQPRICSAQCSAQSAAMQATCNVTTTQMGVTFGTVAPVAGIVVGIIQPELGFPVFKAVVGIGGGLTAYYYSACSATNAVATRSCMAKASSNGC